MPTCKDHRTVWGDPFAPCPDCELDALRKAPSDKVLDATKMMMDKARAAAAWTESKQPPAAQRGEAQGFVVGQAGPANANQAASLPGVPAANFLSVGQSTRYVACGICRIHVDTWLKAIERYDPFTCFRLCEDCYQKRYVHKLADPPVNGLRTALGRPALPQSDAERKTLPIFDGLLMYFPLACAEVARVSKVGNDQHNPGEPMHWAREKSTDQMNTAVRHLMDNGMGHHIDTDGTYHLAKAAWRTLAQLELLLEKGV